MLNILNKTGNVNQPFKISSNKNEKLSDNITVIIDQEEQKQIEKDKSNLFSFTLKLNSVVENVLFNRTGDQSYENILDNRNYNNEEALFEYTEQQLRYINNGRYGYYLDNLCDVTEFKPQRKDLTLNTDNYDIYFAIEDVNIDIEIDGNLLSHGLSVIDYISVVVNDKNYYKITTNFKHNLVNGNTVALCLNNVAYAEKKVKIIDDYVFLIDVNLTIASNSTIKKSVGGTLVDYYAKTVQKIKKVVETHKMYYGYNIYNIQPDYILEQNLEIYKDKVFIYLEKTPFIDGISFNRNLNGLEQHSSVDRNNVFKVNYGNNDTDITNANIVGIYEFDNINQTETKISNVYNIINTADRIANNYQECYFFNKVLKIILKDKGALKIDNGEQIYGYYDGFNTFFREFISFSRSNKFEFVNNNHIVLEDLNFLLRRQDLYNQYDKGNTYDFIHKNLPTEDIIPEITC